MPPEDHQGLLLSATVSLLLHLALLSTNNLGIPAPSTQTSTQAPARLNVTFAESRVEEEKPAIIAITRQTEEIAPNIPPSKASSERERPSSEPDITAPTLQTDLFDLWSKKSVQETGKLTLRVLVDKNGRAKKLQVMRSTFSRETEAQIVKLFFEATYAPGSRSGKSSDMVAEFEVENQ